MSEELKQAGGNQNLEQPVELTAQFATRAHIYDLRIGKYLGESSQFTFTLDPWRPSLFALVPDKIATGDAVSHLLATPIN